MNVMTDDKKVLGWLDILVNNDGASDDPAPTADAILAVVDADRLPLWSIWAEVSNATQGSHTQ